MAGKAAVSLVFLAAIIAAAQPSGSSARTFENSYVKMTILPGWTVTSSPPEVKVTQGKYVLIINPIYQHASGVEGGRFGEATSAMPSVNAVRADVEGPWGTTCALDGPGEDLVINANLSLSNLYTNETKSNVNDGCKFPSDGQSVWFGSLYVGAGSESEYTITLAYDTSDVNELPTKGAPELTQVLNDAKTMLKTLQLKPPLVISGIEPTSALAGAKITVFGSGFNLPSNNVRPSFVKLRDLDVPKVAIAPDGKSLTFVLPTSISVSTCPPGYIMKDEYCVLEPAAYDATDDCPRRSDGSANFCGVPIPSGTYELKIVGSMVESNPITLSVLPSKPTPVFISMLYPDHGISPGETITVRGRGFALTNNIVKIGDSVVPNVSSPDGETLTFQAPSLSEVDLTTSGAYLKASVQASVENAIGNSNFIRFDYWYSSPNALHWQKGGIRINVAPQSNPKN
jgi:hypothetical protein